MAAREEGDVKAKETTAPMPADVACVSLVRVSKRFGNVLALDRVSFDVARSEFFSLLGPSGCGKTTTLRMLAGFETPTEGNILLEGRDASRVPPYRRNTNMVFQNYALFPHMTVIQNVAFGPERKRLPRREIQSRVQEVLEAVRLRELSSRYPRELSGGQQQRVALARALANRPTVLLLDEPLGALDLKLREEMQFELKRIQREVGISFVYVTHDQGEAMTMSDRIAVMNHGRIEHLGPPEEIYLRPASRFVADFIGRANFLPCAIEAVDATGVSARLMDGTPVVALNAADGCRPGQNGLVMVRPEHLKIHSAEAVGQGRGGIRARLLDETFQGSVARYQVETSDGSRLVIITSSDERLTSASPGESVWVSWSEERVYILPNGSAEPRGPETG